MAEKHKDYKVGEKYYKLLSYDWKTDKHEWDFEHEYECIACEYLHGFIPLGTMYCAELGEYVNGNLFAFQPVSKADKQANLFDMVDIPKEAKKITITQMTIFDFMEE